MSCHPWDTGAADGDRCAQTKLGAIRLAQRCPCFTQLLHERQDATMSVVCTCLSRLPSPGNTQASHCALFRT
ncbi:hypothetical protein PUNSTDRAFT_122244 [Punctularia strigosozonata HHB-11173 SS5]|uniref:uncharacterized protein n=1 Tax=Punctularia strigosozonata (strain HHB-11173) TaxID=741275 RepID=UPI0004417F2A|nr:uncharacterized protein PUNSTDRAFT_122244 [Punctularia strigosozonata HHB-11173 SS5]EIN05835.1 hypothetical protein PUNSTDRAFT_122244 [Punctularia strigosozonata HHB-11173 SS5]